MFRRSITIKERTVLGCCVLWIRLLKNDDISFMITGRLLS